jgi:purine-binding chemotaxis protein CheW
MHGLAHLAILAVDDRHLGLPLSSVERVVRAVEVTPVPNAPRAVLGVINMQGRIVPVVSLRRRCGLPEREIRLTDQLVIARDSRSKPVALLVDHSEIITPSADAQISTQQMLPESSRIHSVMKWKEGLVLVYEPDVLLALEDEVHLDLSMHDSLLLADQPGETP